jgi:hypothetical protein
LLPKDRNGWLPVSAILGSEIDKSDFRTRFDGGQPGAKKGTSSVGCQNQGFEFSAHHCEHDFSPRMRPLALQHLVGDSH